MLVQQRKAKSAPWLPEVLTLWAFLFTRLWRTLVLPAYIDEGSMIIRARYIEQGRYLWEPLIIIGKWLQPAATALFAPDGPETLWIARATSALVAVLACGATIALGRMLASRAVGRLAGLFYILPALGFFNERSAVSDVWLAGFAAFALAVAVRLALRRRPLIALPLSLSVIAAVLSKISAVTLFASPILAALILPRRKADRTRALLLAGGAVALAAAALIAVFLVGQARVVTPQEAAGVAEGLDLGPVCRFSLLCETEGDSPVAGTPDGGEEPQSFGAQFLRNLSNGRVYSLWLWFLVGPPMLALAVVALFWLRSDLGRGVTFLWVDLLVRTLALITIGGWLPIRNFLPTQVPLAVLAALGLSRVWRWLEQATPQAQSALRVGSRGAVVAGALVVVLWSVPLDLAFATNPQDVFVPPLNPYDCLNRSHYAFAYGYPQVAQTLRDWRADDPRRLNVVAETKRHMLSYWGPRVGEVEEWAEEDSLRINVAVWLMNGESVFFVDEVPTRMIPDQPFGATLETVADHPIPCGDVSIRVRRLVADSPELRHSIYEIAFPNPNEQAEQYRLLALHLIETGAQGAVVAYPPNQLPLLESRLQGWPGLDGIYALGDMWPLDSGQVEQSLAQLAAEHGQLHVVLLGEERGDPTHSIENWLNANMRLTSEDGFGPVRLLNYTPVP